jgi:hypothetical protein
MAPLVWLERARGRRRLALLVLYVVVAGFIALLGWWSLSLRNLPDVGDPFDVAAFRKVSVPDDQNAFTLYDQAIAQLKDLPNSERGQPLNDALDGGLAAASPKIRAWFEANRGALEIWRRGTERPRAFHGLPEGPAPRGLGHMPGWRYNQALSSLARLAKLEARRREDQGDREAAWGWYRAILRSSRHVEMYGSTVDRNTGVLMYQQVAWPIQMWASDPKVDPALLRRILAELKAIDAQTPPPSQTLKVDYLIAMAELDAAEPPSPHAGPRPDEDTWYRFLPLYTFAEFHARREPERGRRVVRLFYANWLPYADRPAATRPAFIWPGGPGAIGFSNAPGVFDARADPSAPASARALDPPALARWLDSSTFAGPALYGGDPNVFGREAQARAMLLVELARELYRRDHGSFPATDQALVGPYLDRLPDMSPRALAPRVLPRATSRRMMAPKAVATPAAKPSPPKPTEPGDDAPEPERDMP